MKRILIISLGLLLLASSIMATDTRVMTMGDNNLIMLDEANIWLFPSRINYYPDLASMELAQRQNYFILQAPGEGTAAVDGSGAIERVGVNLKFGGDSPYVIGLYLHDNFSTYNSNIPIFNNLNSNKRGDFFYGRKLGELNFGMHLGYVHSSYENLSGIGSSSFNSNSYSEFNLAFGITKDDKLDIMVGLESFDFTDIRTVQLNTDSASSGPNGGMDNFKPDGNSRIYFNARYFHELNTIVTAVPHLSFSKGTYKWNEFDWIANVSVGSGGRNWIDETSETKVTEFNLGCGMHYTPATNVLTVIDFGLETYKSERSYTDVYTRDAGNAADSVRVTDTEYTWTALPYIKLGFEAEVFKWMDVRFGATTYWKKTTDENRLNSTKSSYKFPQNSNYLGFGFNWGRFHVDTYANPQIFLDGFDFIAGANDGQDQYYDQQMNLKISAVYEMH